MVKVKNKKSNLADTYADRRKKQQLTKKTLTPFEVHVNRDKQKVLGRKSKADRGLPGIARTRAIAKRKNTLLLEYKVKDKDNIFLDRRIGEKNSGMSQEDKAMARFAAERIKAHNKKNIFNLNDDEVLTHRGQTLMDIEKYDNPRSDEDEYSDDENRTGKLDKKFVEDAHFGGGVLSKPDSEMSRKDLIDQLIAESKKRKAERQKIREQTIDLTEKLDSEWKDLLPLVSSSHKKLDTVEEKHQVDDYDKAMRELKFEARGMATDKLKSEEEIAKEEKIKLEKLEEDRLARMKGFSEEAEFQKKHRSADDLDDFHIEKIEESENEDNENLISILKHNNKNENEIEGSDVEDEEEDDEEEEEEEDEDQEEDQERKKKEEIETDEIKGKKEEEGEEDEEEGEEDEEEGEEDEEDSESGEESDEESEDDLSDLKDSDSSDDEEVNNKSVNNISKIKIEEKVINKKTDKIKKNEVEDKINVNVNLSEKSTDTVNTNDTKISKVNCNNERSNKVREDMMDKARKELPYTFKAPASYEELQDLFKGRNPDYQSVIIERIIKCNHWKLAERNKEKLLNLFTYLLQYVEQCASVNSIKELKKFFEIFDRLCPHFYDLTHANPEATKNIMHNILKEKHTLFENNIKVYPGLDTLILFKLVSIMYPTSDFRHPIATPCLVFMSQILLRCKVKGKLDISKGLFICSLVLEYTCLNKRWSPDVINFLRGVIYVALPKPFSKVIKVIPPFKTVGEYSNLLVLEDNHKNSEIDPETIKMQVQDIIEEEMDDEYRIKTFITAINLLFEFKELYSELDCVYTIFEPILTLFKSGSLKRYPKKIKEKVKILLGELEKLNEKDLEYLTFDKKKPKALRLLEPRIEVVHDGKRHRPMSKEKAEKEKLLHKLKKETKSAIREIRRDTAFLAKVKIKEQIASDAERKRKVREIFGDAAMQQSELKKLKKK